MADQDKKDDKAAKGNLQIKTVAFLKGKRIRNFKCKLCEHILRAQKEVNDHHKDNHEKLTYVVCDKKFATPSGLDWHKHRHTQKNLKIFKTQVLGWIRCRLNTKWERIAWLCLGYKYRDGVFRLFNIIARKLDQIHRQKDYGEKIIKDSLEEFDKERQKKKQDQSK